MAEVSTVIWATAILAVIFGALIAGAFYLGAKAQKDLGVLFEINLEKARSKYKTMKNLPEELPAWAGSTGIDLSGPAKTGSEHPAGPRPPSPQEISNNKRKVHDWTEALKTAKVKKVS